VPAQTARITRRRLRDSLLHARLGQLRYRVGLCVIDATAATGPVTAELTVRDQSGVVIARKKQAATIPAGQAGRLLRLGPCD
jgi:hypothetical protein